MKTENVLSTVTVDRVGTLQALRVIDFAKLAAESEDGKIDAKLLTEGGDFSVRFTPNGRDAAPAEFPCASFAGAESFMTGFVACADSRKRAPSAAKAEFNAEDFMKAPTRAALDDLKKPAMIALAKHCGVEFKPSEKKGEIADKIAKAKKIK